MRDLKPEELGHVYGAGGCGRGDGNNNKGNSSRHGRNTSQKRNTSRHNRNTSRKGASSRCY